MDAAAMRAPAHRPQSCGGQAPAAGGQQAEIAAPGSDAPASANCEEQDLEHNPQIRRSCNSMPNAVDVMKDAGQQQAAAAAAAAPAHV